MSSLQRRVGMLILIALFISPIMLFAQDDSTITVVGSGIPAPLINEFASGANVAIQASVTGTNDGFTALCAGEVELTTATRAISAAEESNCTTNGVSFLEFVLGYDILAVIANPDVPVDCVSTLQLNTIFAPSSTIANWNQVDPASGDLPLNLYIPPDNTTAFALLDDLVEGFGVRDEVSIVADSAEIVNSVSATSGTLGVTSLRAAQAAGNLVKILDLNTTTAGCAAPSAENAAGRTYTAAYTLFAYANSANIDAIQPIFDVAFAAESAATISGLGFVPPTEAGFARNRDILANRLTGRQFSKEVTNFTIPQNLVGAINIAGATSGSAYITAVTGAFVGQYPGVTLNQTINGQVDGFAKLCDGTADLIDAFSELAGTDATNCETNNIPTETIDLGAQAVVLLGGGDFLTCLTNAEVATVWSAASEKTITHWNQVNAAFPDLPITLVAPAVGDVYGDLLMVTASGQNMPTREDFAETKPDATYRATASGNVEGGMTYVTWQNFQNLSDAALANVQVVSVDAGSGCVAPSATSIADGTYALSRPLLLIVNRLSMARQEVQALLWTIASDANYSLLSSNSIVGLDFSALPDLRDRLQQAFALAASDAAQAAIDAANATPEPTAEAGVDATAEASTDATPEPVGKATAEATAESTPNS